ncbi:MAG: DUF3298 domain-containing protein [Bacteroidaceae bacterium]
MNTRKIPNSSTLFPTLIISTVFLVLFLFASCSKPVKISTDTFVQNEETKDIELDTKLTIFSSNNSKVNAELESFNTLRIKQVKEDGDTLKDEAITSLQELEQSEYGRPEWKYSYYVTDSLVSLDPKSIISLLQIESSFAGGAHPNTIYKAYNYDLKTHKLLNREDIFNDLDSNELNTIIYNTFQKHNSYNIELFNNPTLKSADAICLTKDQIIFVYNPYTLACYAAGVITIDVDKALISKYINPNF